MIIFINIDKIIFINTTVINRRICYSTAIPGGWPPSNAADWINFEKRLHIGGGNQFYINPGDVL